MIKDEADQRTTEAQLEGALKSRLQHFRDNASSFTLVGIRRLLEEDLGLEKYALDVHKRFIKQFIDKNLHADEDTDSKKSEGKVGEVHSTVEKNKDLSGVSHKDEVKVEDDSPIMGVLTTKTETTGSSQGIEISESMIKKAIEERADYIRLQSQTLSLAGARWYLEEDLQLSKNSLEPFKKFIRQEIEKVMDSGAVSTSSTATPKGSSGICQSNATGSTCTEGLSRSIFSANDAEEHKEKPRAKPIRRGESKKLDITKKRKSSEKTDISGKKQNKLAKRQLEEDSNSESVNDSASEDDESQSAAEKPGKKKEAPTSAFGKLVEHLKSVIKACGMSIAPTVYKKAKLVEESKREVFLIKELEGILLKEGLSKNPSEKEIKEVRKRKEKAKELEGIEMSNIITSSRRRSTMSFVPPPRPKKKDESGDAVVSTKKDKDDAKVANKQQEEDVKDAKKKEDGDHKDATKKEDNRDDEEEGDEEEEEEDDDDDDSQNENFNDDDEGSG